MNDSPWTRRASALAFWLGIAIVVIALAGTTLARFDVIGKLPGFMSFVYSAMAGGGVAVLGLVALVMNWRSGWPAARKAVLAVVIGAAAFGGLSLLRSTAAEYPYIHDATTDLENPPEFVELAIPEDNLRGVDTVEAWKEAHAEGYSDLTPVTVNATPAAVVAKAEELAKERGWTIAAVAPDEGRFEAVAYASWIKFEDIVVLRAVPLENGETLVDMRSISRVGISDLGENAKRIREFLAALQES
ncbi:DUF1499 domain-containing protein [Parerythrobacter aestuarii]|uniref:DUF1499 domain-containing protein n=1 Tax=Parerythrobacter aestuarii TaxID=3020909 RepID=UPI0024DE37C5|nr:DUF1499 domain-containing protein [Parerythrobacter aestuarii]